MPLAIGKLPDHSGFSRSPRAYKGEPEKGEDEAWQQGLGDARSVRIPEIHEKEP